MTVSARERFLSYVRGTPGARPVVSPFLPHPDVVRATLAHLGLPASAERSHRERNLASLTRSTMSRCS